MKIKYTLARYWYEFKVYITTNIKTDIYNYLKLVTMRKLLVFMLKVS